MKIKHLLLGIHSKFENAYKNCQITFYIINVEMLKFFIV